MSKDEKTINLSDPVRKANFDYLVSQGYIATNPEGKITGVTPSGLAYQKQLRAEIAEEPYATIRKSTEIMRCANRRAAILLIIMVATVVIQIITIAINVTRHVQNNHRQKMETINATTAEIAETPATSIDHQKRSLAFFDSASASCAMLFASSADLSTCRRSSSFSHQSVSVAWYSCPSSDKSIGNTRSPPNDTAISCSSLSSANAKYPLLFRYQKLESLALSDKSILTELIPSDFPATSSRISS